MQELIDVKDFYITKNDHNALGELKHATAVVKTTSWFSLKTKTEQLNIFLDNIYWRDKDTLKFVPDPLNHNISAFIRLKNLKPLN